MKGAELNILCNDNGTKACRPINISVLIQIMVAVRMMMVATGDSLLIAAKKLIKVKSFNISFEETKRRWKVIEKAINFTIPCYLYSCQRLADILMKGLCSLRGTCQPAQPNQLTGSLIGNQLSIVITLEIQLCMIFLKALSKMQQTQVLILTL